MYAPLTWACLETQRMSSSYKKYLWREDLSSLEINSTLVAYEEEG